ncbi:D-alanine--poly(phosphoribitol) ligase subunit DltA [Macrococcus equi]|uniref:D-alanine--poly(phosphoribitol) ligase subunit DltA n=1 Tax=Macrococcus equi TaxID=3395462 RepID=UPI0039BDFFD9
MNILKRITHYANTTPDRICFVHRNEQMTYLELELLSNGLSKLIEESYKPLFVYGHMSKWMIVGMIAGLKSGKGYVPIDTSIPYERIQKMIEVIQPEFMLDTELLSPEFNGTLIRPDMIHKEVEYAGEIAPGDVAYTIFTSGSTGTPKGVEILASSLDDFTLWMESLYEGQNENYWLNQAPLSFDLSVMAVYPSIATGSTLVMVDKDMIKKPIEIYQALKQYPITAWVSTPSFLEMCLLLPEFEQEKHPNLKYFYFCGELFKHKTAQTLLNKFSESTIYNTYGPTEATVAVTGIQVTQNILDEYNPLPVGYARPGVELMITDDSEILIKGDAVSIGYVKSPEKTASHFYEEDNIRVYRTGDAGIIKNELLFVNGRLDYQIKLNGYRMELEEIEHVITELEGISQAVVTPIEKNGKVSYLVAHVVKSESIAMETIKQSLLSKLPTYMVPKKFIEHEHIPMTPNGKVDRKQLKEVCV